MKMGLVSFYNKKPPTGLFFDCTQYEEDYAPPIRIRIEAQGRPPLPKSLVKLKFATEEIAILANEEGEISKDCDGCEQKFERIFVNLLKLQKVEIQLSDGRKATFSLIGLKAEVQDGGCIYLDKILRKIEPNVALKDNSTSQSQPNSSDITGSQNQNNPDNQSKRACEGTDRLKWDNCIGSFSNNAGQYEGAFRNGRVSGYGTFKNKNGNSYSGYWENAKFNGQGTLRYADGRIEAGIWKDGTLISRDPDNNQTRLETVSNANQSDANRNTQNIIPSPTNDTIGYSGRPT